MKRHRSLIPISREHHEGLLLATRLQQGRNALLRLWSHDLSWQAAYVVRYLGEHLDRHFKIEEDILFAAASEYLGAEQSMIQELQEQHAELRALAAELSEPARLGEKKLECTLTRFGQLLEQHIRTEERTFFPICEAQIPGDVLDRVGNRIHDALGDSCAQH